jgi:hypothetical protein
MKARAAGLALGLFALPIVLGVALSVPALADPVVTGLDIATAVTFKDTSFILTGSVTIRAGGVLTLDHVSVQVRMDIDNSREIRVLPGGELRVVNGSRVYSQFQSTAYALHYRVFTEPGGHFVFQNSTFDYPYWVGVGDESALISDATISHPLMGLFGSNLTVDRLTVFDSNVGFWLSGHSLVRNSHFDTSTVYAGILDGTSRIEDSTFKGSDSADLALLDNARAVNTTHRNSGRAAIMNGNTSMDGATIENMTISGIQLGEQDFRYGCGIFASAPLTDWLNLHLFTFFYRVNNTVTLKDISISGAPSAISFGREVWRRALLNDTPDDCFSDPPSPTPAQPLFNSVNMTVTRPVVFDARACDFNGSLRILPGGSLTLRGVTWRFLSAGSTHAVDLAGGDLTVEGSSLASGLIDYVADAVNQTRSITPNFDIGVSAGRVSVSNSTLEDLGTMSDAAVDAGIVVADGAGPVDFEDSVVANSMRGVTLGCCGGSASAATRARFVNSALSTEGPTVAVRGGNVTLVNSSLRSNASSGVLALSSSSDLSLFGSTSTVQGQGQVTIYRYGYVQVRAVWEDLRPAGRVRVNVTDLDSGAQVAVLQTAADGWAPGTFMLYRTTVWDGFGEQGAPSLFFIFSVAVGSASAHSVPVDVSLGAVVTLALPDDRPPVVVLNLPAEYYTNVSGGIITGVAEDFETGVTVVELSLDGGPFMGITPPSAPQLGPVNYSTTISGLQEGVHVVAIRAWDSVGNTAETSAYFIFDDHFPALLQFNFDLETNTRLVNVTGRLNEPGSVTIKGNTTNTTGSDYAFSLPLYLDIDSEYIFAVVEDLAGNSYAYPFVARLDDVPPQLEVTSPQNGSWTTQTRVTVSGLIEFNAQLSLNGVPLTVSGTSAFVITAALSEGENVLLLTARDRAGNERKVSLTVFLDSATPALDIVSPDASRWLATRDVTLVLRTERGVTVEVANVSFAAQADIVSVPLHLLEGRNLLSISVTDLAGNKALKGVTLQVDTVRPTLSFTGGANLTTANVSLLFTGLTEPNAVLSVGGYTVVADGTGTFTVPLHLHAGLNSIPVVARDAAGNSVNGTYSVRVDDPRLAESPGLAAPAGGAAILLLLGIAACAVAPFSARTIARRRG